MITEYDIKSIQDERLRQAEAYRAARAARAARNARVHRVHRAASRPARKHVSQQERWAAFAGRLSAAWR